MTPKFLLLILSVFLTTLFSCSNKSNSMEGQKIQSIELKKGNLSVLIDPNTGGRITSFQLKKEEILKQNSSESPNYGSTF
ncbi:MAG: hypothetical protein KTR26_19330 [Flammeovirgaceae bacterium]|nr:hypothetical protein [Flammeovirgaceae bacterium]